MAVLRVHIDEPTDRALVELTAGGASTSDAIRAAIQDAARLRRRERMRDEALALAGDPEDVAEMRRVQEDMEPLLADVDQAGPLRER